MAESHCLAPDSWQPSACSPVSGGSSEDMRAESTLRFPARDLKPYGEYVRSEDLIVGEVYFTTAEVLHSCTFRTSTRTRQGFATKRSALAPRRARINPSRTSTNRHPSNARKRPNIAAYLNSKRRSTSSSHVPCVESRAPRHERAAPQAVAADGAARRR